MVDGQPWNNQVRGWQVRFEEHPRTQPTLCTTETEENKALAPYQDPWRKSSTAKEASNQSTLYSSTENAGHNKLTGLQDINIMLLSAGSNNSEISRAMGKISETNQLLAQQQMTQQNALQALLNYQKSSEVQEASQKIQSQALMALTEATQQRGFDPLFNKIAKYDGKDPEKCHYWLN